MAVITGAVLGGIAAVSSISNGRKSAKAGARSAAASESAAAHQAAIADRQQEIAEQDRDRYKTTFEPIEDELVNETRNTGSIANQNKASQQTAADVASTFSGARARLSKNPGLQPGSQAYLQEANRINLAEAAASATGQTAAREGVKAKGTASLRDTLALGKGLISNSSSALNAAGGAYGSIAGSQAGRADSSGRAAAESWGAAGRVVGGLSQSKGVQDWFKGLGGATTTPTYTPDPIYNAAPPELQYGMTA